MKVVNMLYLNLRKELDIGRSNNQNFATIIIYLVKIEKSRLARIDCAWRNKSIINEISDEISNLHLYVLTFFAHFVYIEKFIIKTLA